MGSLENLGKILMVLGVGVILLGGIIWLAGRLLGNQPLPGTLRFEFPGGSCIIPILASILLSIVLTVVLNLAARWLGK
jgi:hypothetical protein